MSRISCQSSDLAQNKTMGLLTLILWIVFTSTGCALKPKKRILSVEEKSKFQLFGIISDARICPTIIDEKRNMSIVVGPCEIVNCTQTGSEIKCLAEPE